ncbi:hypothetical protein ACQY0O_001376 [Thecaphora frezii]
MAMASTTEQTTWSWRLVKVSRGLVAGTAASDRTVWQHFDQPELSCTVRLATVRARHLAAPPPRAVEDAAPSPCPPPSRQMRITLSYTVCEPSALRRSSAMASVDLVRLYICPVSELSCRAGLWFVVCLPCRAN